MSKEKRRKVLQFLGYSIPILLVIYVLSVGPVAALTTDSNGSLEQSGYLSQIVTFYTPLSLVVKSNFWLEYLYKEYIVFWQKIL